jgi:hypothetical protein
MGARDLEARAREALEQAVEHARDARLAADFADDAVRLAEEVDDPVLLATALDARLTTRSGPDDLEARLGTSLRLLALVRQEPDPDVRLAAHVWRLTTALEQLDLSTVRRQLAALDLLADETREGRARFHASSRRAMFALTEGDTVGAARLTADAAEVGAGVPEAEAVLGSLQVELARHRGDRAALSRHARELEEHGRSTHLPSVDAEAAVLWVESGEPGRARRLVDLHAPDLGDLPRDGDWLLTVSNLCEAAVGSGRPGTAEDCARLLAPYAGRAVLKPLAQVFSGVVDDYLALATGDPARADEARAAYQRIGADWWVRRGPLGHPHEGSPTAPRVLHLHPAETEGATRLWCVGREGSLRRVPSMRGLEYIRLLLQSPGVDLPAQELSAAADPDVVDSGTGTLVDQQALAEHRRQAREAAAAPPDPGRTEQARSAVRKAIRAALARLELHDGEVAHALRTTIRVGATCRYEPDPFRAVEWRLERAHPVAHPTSGP